MKESAESGVVILEVPMIRYDYQMLAEHLKVKSQDPTDFIAAAIVEKMAREGIYPARPRRRLLVQMVTGILRFTFKLVRWVGARIKQAILKLSR